jgi:hypothetical protein
MFAALVFVCGLNVPTAVEGCGISFAPKPFRTHAECMKSLTLEGLPSIEARLPEGAFIADAQCVLMQRAA